MCKELLWTLHSFGNFEAVWWPVLIVCQPWNRELGRCFSPWLTDLSLHLCFPIWDVASSMPSSEGWKCDVLLDYRKCPVKIQCGGSEGAYGAYLLQFIFIFQLITENIGGEKMTCLSCELPTPEEASLCVCCWVAHFFVWCVPDCISGSANNAVETPLTPTEIFLFWL